MKADTLRVYKSVHTWAGIISGMALFIGFYAGALTIFKQPLTRWATPPAIHQAVPLEQAQQLIVKTLQQQPTVAKDFQIHLRQDEQVPARMSWRVPDPNADDHDQFSTRHYTARLDANGLAAIEQSQPAPVAEFIDVLHRVVGLPVDNDPARWFMGAVAILYFLALVSGVILLLPSLVRDFFAMRVGKNLKRMWLDAHNVVGIISLPFHVLIALTAVVFAFHDGIYLLQNHLLHDDKMATAFRGPRANAGVPLAREPANMRTPAELVASVRALSPTFEPSALQYQHITSPRAVVRIWGSDSTAVMPRARGGFVAVDPYSGKVVNSDYLPGKQNAPSLIISSLFALHMGSFGGTPVKWMYFLLGMAGAWLFYSGNLLWIESRRRKAARGSPNIPVQTLSARMMASGTIGVCLGCICGISLIITGSKWLHGHVGNLYEWLRILYYATFFGCIIWAFWRGVARAAVHLLWLATLLTLAIPLTSLLAWLFPATGLWVNPSAAALGVDATAFAGALGFAWMARATSHRIWRNEERDSVWSGYAPTRQIAISGKQTHDG
ncbi:MAG: PepSY-associated helix family protein 10 [Burkholderiaceae bacterium]|nr:PepSY-associated helix family protein 10 [Burkholderiaceae bacterium]